MPHVSPTSALGGDYLDDRTRLVLGKHRTTDKVTPRLELGSPYLGFNQGFLSLLARQSIQISSIHIIEKVKYTLFNSKLFYSDFLVFYFRGKIRVKHIAQ